MKKLLLQRTRTAPPRRPAPNRPHRPGLASSVRALQRALGNQVIQRKIGFEIETGIPAKKRLPDGSLEEPTYEDFNVPIAGGSKLDVDANPSGGGKILEFASVAVDDKQDPATFATTATGWLTLLTTLRDSARRSPPLRRLQHYLPAAPAEARYGVEQGSPGDMNRVSIQMTHGLQLHRVREFLRTVLATMENPSDAGRVKAKKGAALEAGATGGQGVDLVLREVDKTLQAAGEMPNNVTARQKEQLAGFYAMLSYYMLAGKAVASGYIKNRAALFYKSKLSDVRNKLVTDNPYAKAVLENAEAVTKAAFILLVITKRKANEPLYVGTNAPIIANWLNDVLSGTDDPAFEAAKNPWGTDIKPGIVGGRRAAVVEHRDIDKVVPPQSALKLSEPDEIVAYLQTIFEANQAWQNLR